MLIHYTIKTLVNFVVWGKFST